VSVYEPSPIRRKGAYPLEGSTPGRGSRLTKEPREKIYEAFDKLDKLTERWNQRLTLDNLALTERYLKGELRIIVNLRQVVAALGRDFEEYCAIFQRKLPVCRANTYRQRNIWWYDQFGGQVGDVVEGAGKVENEALVCHAHGHQELVFIRDIELMETPERVVRSLVRLGFLDEVYGCLRRSLYLSRRTGFKSIGEGYSVFEHREPGIRLDLFPFGTNQLADQQVEGGPEIVDCIADDGTPPERRLGQHSKLKEQIACIRIVIGEDFVGVGLQEALDQGFEIADVLLGPFDLYPDTAEVGLASHAPEVCQKGEQGG
jgi:hypothetical protein